MAVDGDGTGVAVVEGVGVTVGWSGVGVAATVMFWDKVASVEVKVAETANALFCAELWTGVVEVYKIRASHRSEQIIIPIISNAASIPPTDQIVVRNQGGNRRSHHSMVDTPSFINKLAVV